ncbi:hypothetical protein FSP39_007892 [Pinctada imbricata]|uniref:Uncharacterized protein n=1 Tax=Pinctada imbricata TaxID=66713 RepID=A0AA89C373_PINIB|nr:hypothetical protein FSP39_007892 [Pinctada imbricata]
MSESLHVEESISSSEITDSDIGNKKRKRKKERFLPTCSMSRENCLSSSSSSSKSSTVLTIDTFPPLQASDWKLKHLLKIGITYADRSMTLSDFVSALKVKPELVRHGFTELPVMYNAVCSKLTEISKDVWDFSFDMDKFVKCQSSMLKMGDSSTRDAMILEQMDRLESAIKSLENSKQELRARLSDLQINDAVDRFDLI